MRIDLQTHEGKLVKIGATKYLTNKVKCQMYCAVFALIIYLHELQFLYKMRLFGIWTQQILISWVSSTETISASLFLSW